MIEIKEKDRCTGCHACANICPKQCIAMEKDSEGFLYPVVNTKQCINCGVCEKICPILSGKTAADGRDIKAYAAINNNEEIRLKSSSGGMFTLVAEKVLGNSGVVFGATFDKDFNVVHAYTETKEELEQFRGSKYVQSKIGETYKQAKSFLESGRMVLFTGTPCQIGGLYAYLGKDYENLITQDFICHGVPSPMVWQKYLEYRESISRASVRKISFRYKKYGWKKYSVALEFSNATEYLTRFTEDPYMQVFLRDLCLRPSCYDCAFKTKYRQADITLADFWGIDKVLPEMDDDKGTSLLIIHSEKGTRLFHDIENSLTSQLVNLDDVLKYNSSMLKSVSLPRNREIFIKKMQNKPFDKTYNKFHRNAFIVRLKRKAKAILTKFRKS